MPAFTSVRPLCTAVNTYLDKVQLTSGPTQAFFTPSSPCSPSIHSDNSSDYISSIFDSATDADDDASSMTSISVDELPIDLAFIDDGYDSAEEADDEDYLNKDDPCPCSGCQDRGDRIAHRVRIPVADGDRSDAVPTPGTRSLASDDGEVVPLRDYTGWGLTQTSSANSVSGGLGPYQLWPLPIGTGRPNRKPYQGHSTTTDNVTISVTPTIRAPAEDFEGLSISSSGWEAFRFHYTPPVSACWQYMVGASDPLRDDEDEVVGGGGMRVIGQSWAF